MCLTVCVKNFCKCDQKSQWAEQKKIIKLSCSLVYIVIARTCAHIFPEYCINTCTCKILLVEKTIHLSMHMNDGYYFWRFTWLKEIKASPKISLLITRSKPPLLKIKILIFPLFWPLVLNVCELCFSIVQALKKNQSNLLSIVQCRKINL